MERRSDFAKLKATSEFRALRTKKEQVLYLKFMTNAKAKDIAKNLRVSEGTCSKYLSGKSNGEKRGGVKYLHPEDEKTLAESITRAHKDKKCMNARDIAVKVRGNKSALENLPIQHAYVSNVWTGTGIETKTHRCAVCRSSFCWLGLRVVCEGRVQISYANNDC